MERFGFIFLVAGLGFFALAFGVSAYLPTLSVQNIDVQSIEQLAEKPPLDFVKLREDYPQAFRKAFYQTTDREAIEKLKADYADVYEAVFVKTDEQALAFLHKTAIKVFEQVFPDMSVDEAIDEFSFDRDEMLEQIKAADAGVYAATFEDTIDSALAMLHADYVLTLLRIKRADAEAYRVIFDERPDSEVFAEALQIGHGIYIAEACWHCHSQQVRPWGRDEARYGQLSYPEEYHNAMNYPPMWGTRRIGPDLIRRGGVQSNDWHVAHFANPRHTSPVSVMPSYPWFFEDDGVTLNKKGLSIITYVQWLGSWQASREATLYSIETIDRAYDSPPTPAPAPAPGSAPGPGSTPGVDLDGD